MTSRPVLVPSGLDDITPEWLTALLAAQHPESGSRTWKSCSTQVRRPDAAAAAAAVYRRCASRFA
jgi:hypothetical protein